VASNTASFKRDYRARIDACIAEGPFDATWDSLRARRIPDWYVDGKFGIFIHWGAYAVPAFGNEWYPRNMYIEGSPEFDHHRQQFGDHSRIGYKDLIARFRAEAFDPGAWAELFRDAGAQFVVPVAEHHDGFAMYQTDLSEWNAARRGPRRDVIAELAESVRAASMVFGVSSHRAEHWWFQHPGRHFDSDVRDPKFADLYGPAMPQEMPPNEDFLEDWLIRTAEVVDRFQPSLVWFDWWIETPVFEPYLRQFAAYYYNRAAQWRRSVAINYKHNAFPPGTAVFDIERGQLAGLREEFWQTDTAVQRNSWGYTEHQQYKGVADLIGDLVDIVSKNGALLLNIGPRADGSIPTEEQELLRGIGSWLQVNGEAIYGTRPAAVYGEGPTEIVEGSFNDTARRQFGAADIRFTTRQSPGSDDLLFAIPLAWPEDDLVRISSIRPGGPLDRQVHSVQLLGHDADLSYEQADGGLTVVLPAGVRPHPVAPTLRIRTAPPRGY